MSFVPFNDGDNRRSYWKELLLAVAPAFVASVVPPVVMHYLEKSSAKEPEPEKKDPTTKP